MIKLIVSDMDGTFLNNHQEISEYNLNALKYAQSKGVEFMIATGRNHISIKPLVEKYGIHCSCMLMNGAEFRDSRDQVQKKIPISYEKGKKLLDLLESQGFYPEIMDSDGFYTIYGEEEARISMLGRMRCLRPDASETELEKLMNESVFFNSMIRLKSYEELQERGILFSKTIVFNQDTAVIADTKKKVMELGGLAVTSSYPTNVEINDIHAQKGIALSEYIAERGIKKEEVMVFGDGLNDYSLFTEFPNSFAPENAMEEIRNIASEIIESNENNGVGKTIIRYI